MHTRIQEFSSCGREAPGPTDRKNSNNAYFSPKLNLQFYREGPMVNFDGKSIFPRFQRGSNILQEVKRLPGGPNASRVVFVDIFNVIRVTLITSHLQTTVRRKLRKTWVSKAPRHVSG